MDRSSRPRPAFSLIELLVVIGIIALLIAILLPVVSRIRASARTSTCLSNLHQWGLSFQLYLNANKGNPFATFGDDSENRFTRPRWWELLAPYNDNVRANLLCPAAAVPKNNSPDSPSGAYQPYEKGSANTAWRVRTYQSAGPAWIIRADWRGSYAFNYWIQPPHPGWGNRFLRLPAPQSDRIPVIGDSCDYTVAPVNFEQVPRNLQQPEFDNLGIPSCCIDRHQMCINIVFLDGHTQTLPLAELWQLKWNDPFIPQQVQVPRP